MRQPTADQRGLIDRAGDHGDPPVSETDEVIGRVAIPGPVRRGDGRHGLVADADGATLDEPFPR